MNQPIKKYKVKINTSGMLTAFGYKCLRTPAIVYLTDNQITMLRAQYTDFEILTDDNLITEKELAKTFPDAKKTKTDN